MQAKAATPTIHALDCIFPLINDPYHFISKQCQRKKTDIVKGRLLLEDCYFITGPDAAKLFYNKELFTRDNALPCPVKNVLFGKGAIQGIEGKAHRHRKAMWLSVAKPPNFDDLRELSEEQWELSAKAWMKEERVRLYPAVKQLLTRVICDWASVPLADNDIARRADDLSSMYEGVSKIGPGHFRARLGRYHSERWIVDVVERVRSGKLSVPEDSPCYVIATHKDLNGELLPANDAAAEILSLLRPTVAVAVFITFAAHALHENPGCREHLRQENNNDYLEWFVQEVRRYYPFFPGLLARTLKEVSWQGVTMAKGSRVMLDIVGNNHDARAWKQPNTFDPHHFKHWDESPYNFIPQGGGSHETNHRCAGEWLTIELIKQATNFLVKRLDYRVPPQDLTIDDKSMPALPKSHLLINNIRWQPQAATPEKEAAIFV